MEWQNRKVAKCTGLERNVGEWQNRKGAQREVPKSTELDCRVVAEMERSGAKGQEEAGIGSARIGAAGPEGSGGKVPARTVVAVTERTATV